MAETAVIAAIAAKTGASAATVVAVGAAATAAVASIAISSVQAKKAEADSRKDSARAPRDITVRSAIEPARIIYGEARTSGPVVYTNTASTPGTTDNSTLWTVISLCNHEVEDITDVWLDGDKILASQIVGGNVTSGKYGPIGSNYITNIYKRYGTSTQTHVTQLADAFTDWTSAYDGRGVAYIVTGFELGTATGEGVWAQGAPQNIRAVVKGKKVYDPRKDSTNGGSGTHRLADPTTWEWSDNPALCVADYLFDSRLGMGAEGITYDEIDWAMVTTAANVCDSTVTSPAGNQKRFTCNGALSTGETYAENIKQLLSSMAGSLTWSGGKFRIRALAYEAPTYTFTGDDVIGDVQIQPETSRAQRFNLVRGTFIDPASDYVATEFIPVENTTFRDDRDGGQTLNKQIKLPFTNNEYMAQRIAYKQLNVADQQLRCVVPMNYKAMKVAVGDRIQLSIEELSWSNKPFLVEGWVFSPNGGYELTLQEESSSAYADPALGDYSTRTWAGDVVFPDPDVPAPSGLAATNEQEAVLLTWDAPSRPSAYDEVVVYASSSSSWSGASEIGRTRGTTFRHEIDIVPATYPTSATYYYWVRAVDIQGDESIRNPNSDTSSVQGIAQKISTTNLSDDANFALTADWPSVTDSLGTAPDDNATDNGYTIDGDGNIAGSINTETTGDIHGGQTAYDTGIGYFLGYDTNAYKFSIGNSSGNKLTFDGSNLSVTGAITANSGSIASSVTIGGTQADTVVSGAAAGATALQNGDDITDGTVGGVTITSTKLYQGTGTFNNTNTGFYLDNAGQFSLKDKLSFDGTDLTVSGDITAASFTLSSGATLTDTDGQIANVAINLAFPVDGLTYYWPCNSIANDELVDVVNGKTGVHSGATPTLSTDSPSGNAVVNALGSGWTLLSDTDADALEGANGFAWSIWFKSETTTGDSGARIIGRDASDGWALVLDQDGTSQGLVLYGEPGTESMGTVATNEWHHFVLSEDGNGTISGYLDGELIGTESYTPVDSSRPVVIGCNTESSINTSASVFIGKLTEVRAYNRALTAIEVRALYKVPAGGLPQKIDGDLIVDGTITATQIAANAVTAGKINVSSLADINPDAGTITGGSVGGTTITSTKLYQGTGTFNNTNTGFYLDSDGKFSLKDKLAFFPTDNTLRVKGNIEADVITVNQNLQVVGDLKASSLAIASITREMFTQDALDEIYGALATAVGGSNGDYKEASGSFTTSGGTVTLALFDHGVNEVVVEWLENYGFSQTTDYSGTALQATLTFEASTTSNFATIAASKTETITLNKYNLSVYYGSTYFWYYGPRSVTKTFTTSDLTDTTDYYFRVRVTNVGAAFTGITYPFEVEANEGVTGVVSTGGNADTLDNLDSTAFLRSNVDDTFDANLTVTGNLTVQGTTVTLNTATLDVEDKNITLNYGAGDTSGSANGAGITIQDAVNSTTDATIKWDAADDEFDVSHGINVVSGNIKANTTDGYIQARSLILENSEITDTHFANSFQMIVDANDVDSDVPGHGDHASSYPFGVYFLGDNDQTTKTLGTGLVKLWNTGHFKKAHIDHFVGLYSGTQNLTVPTVTSSSSSGGFFYAENTTTTTANDDLVGGFLFKNNDTSGTEPHYAGMTARTSNIYGSMALEFFADRADYEADTPAMSLYADGADSTTNTLNLTGSTSITGAASISSSGTVSASGGDSSEWNTAYGWGNHASAGYLTSLSFDNLTGKTAGTGDYSTTGDLVAGRNSGSIALTINDGKGNSNVAFNHQNGVPDQDGNAARIEVNTDSSTGAAMWFELKSGVTDGVGVDLTNIFHIDENGLDMDSGMGIKINGTEVISSSRDLTPANITATGSISGGGKIKTQHDRSDSYSDTPSWTEQDWDTLVLHNGNSTTSANQMSSIFMRAEGGGSASSRIVLRNDNSGNGRLYFMMRSGSHTSTQQPKMLITDDGYVTISDNATTYNERLFVDGTLRAENGIKIGATQIIDSNRDFTNVNSLRVTGVNGLAIGKAPTSFGAGVSTLTLAGTSSTNGRAGAIWFKEYDGTDTGAIYSTDGNDGYGTVMVAYQGDLKLATGTLSGYALIAKANKDVNIVSGGLQMGGTEVISSSRDLTPASITTTSNVQLPQGYNLQWGGAYSAGNPSISAGSNFIAFYPTGNTDGEVIKFDASGIDVNGHSIIDVNTIQITGASSLRESADRGGLIELTDSGGTWTGIQISKTEGDHWSVMGSTTSFGLYDDQNADWILLHDQLGATTLYHAGNSKISTTSSGVSVTGTVQASADIEAQGGYMNLSTYTSGTVPITVGMVDIRSAGKTGWAPGDELGKIRWYANDTSGNWPGEVASIRAVNQDGNGSTTTVGSAALEFYTSPYNSITQSMALRLNTDQSATFPGAISSGAIDIDVGTTSGTLISLTRNGGTEIGRIAYSATDNVAIYGTTAAHAGINFIGGAIIPMSAGAEVDNTISLGDSARNMKEVHTKSIKVAGTEVLTSARNLTNISTITATGGGHTLSGGTTTFNVGRGDVYFENNTNSNAAGAGITLRTSVNPSGDGSIFDVRSSGQAIRFYVGQDLTSSGYNPFYVGCGTTSGQGTASNYSIELAANGNIIAEGNITAYGSASDIRLKENIEPITDALSKVKRLDGVTFTYKKDGSRSTGVIAQQVQEVLPEVIYESAEVGKSEDGEKFLAVRYGQMMGLAIEAIKELSAEVDSLKAKLKELEDGNH